MVQDDVTLTKSKNWILLKIMSLGSRFASLDSKQYLEATKNYPNLY